MVLNSLLDVSSEQYCLSDKSTYVQLADSAVVKTEEEFYQPITGEGPYGNGSRITFRFQPKGFVDWSTLRFEGAITLTRNTATVSGDTMPYWCVTATGGIEQAFRRLVIRIGSTVVVDVDNYNSWCAWLQLNNVPAECGQFQQACLEGQQFHQNSLTQFLGQPDQTYNVAATQSMLNIAQLAGPGGSSVNALDPTWNIPNTSRQREHRFAIGFLNVQKYFPAHLVGNFQMDLYLDNDYRYIKTYTTNFGAACTVGATATLSKCRIYYSTVTLLPALEESVRKMVENNALYIPFLQIRNHIQNIPPNATTYVGKISEKVASLKSVFILPQLIDDYNVTKPPTGILSPGENTLQRFSFSNNVWPSFVQPNFLQFQINGLFHPTYPITTPNEFYIQRMIACGTFYTRKPGGLDSFRIFGFAPPTSSYFLRGIQTTNRFWPEESVMNQWIGYDFDRENCPELTTGYNSTLTQSDIKFTIGLNNANTSSIVLNIFTLFNSTLRILSNGSIDVAR